jgi:predicted kinase
MMKDMPSPPSSRSVKIGVDERTGWSSERPRREGVPPRPPDVSVRSRVLRPSDRLRYSPGSLLLVVGAKASRPEQFLERTLEERGLVFSMAKVRGLLAGRVPEDQIEPRAQELLDAAVVKRLKAKQTVVIATESLDPAERQRYVQLAHSERGARHLLLIETPRDQVLDEERPQLDELRRSLDAGELGAEGFHTALRLAGSALSEVNRIVFRPPPRED